MAEGARPRVRSVALATDIGEFGVPYMLCTGPKMCVESLTDNAETAPARQICVFPTKKSPKCTDPTIRTAFGRKANPL